MGAKSKCIIILSTKSAGSSALQSLLCRFGGGKHVLHTRHNEHETLYWTKAASALGMPQVELLKSEVPIAKVQAQEELLQFLEQNARGFSPSSDQWTIVRDGWRELCLRHAPV